MLQCCSGLKIIIGKELCIKLKVLAPVVEKMDSAIQQINFYPVDSAIGFPNTYPVDRAIQLLNNWGLVEFSFCMKAKTLTRPRFVF